MANSDRADFFLAMLGEQERINLAAVRRGLEVPCPTPTQADIEEAQDAQCREGVSVLRDGSS